MHDRFPKALDRAGLRKFGLVTGVGFSSIFGVLLPWLISADWPVWPHLVGAFFCGAGLVAPRTLGPIYRVWMAVGQVLGAINSRILLTLVYVLVVTPLGGLRRLVGKDTLAKAPSSAVDTYRIPSEKRHPTHVERPF